MTDTWCVLPWVHMCVRTNNTLKPCCRYMSKSPTDELNTSLDDVFNLGVAALNDNTSVVIREKMLAGKKLSGCKKCYSQEEHSDLTDRQSLRQVMNSRFSDIKKEKCTTDFQTLRYIEMSVDNICNLQCKMCNSMFSSRLINRDKVLGNTVHKKLEPNFHKFDNVDLTHLDVVKILGGEPFITPNFEKFIDYLIDRSIPENITLDIATNGTVIPSTSVIAKLNKFKRINAFVSLDSYSTSNDYQRYGSSYQQVFDNAVVYGKIFENIFVTFHAAVTILTANDLANTLNVLIKKHNYHVSVDFVRDPTYLSLLYAPQSYIDWVLDINKTNNTAYRLIETHVKTAKFSDNEWREFINNIEILDTYYNTKLEDYNVELARYLHNEKYRIITNW